MISHTLYDTENTAAFAADHTTCQAIFAIASFKTQTLRYIDTEATFPTENYDS